MSFIERSVSANLVVDLRGLRLVKETGFKSRGSGDADQTLPEAAFRYI